MFTAYLDESGHESGQHVIVAGFLGNDDQWDNFTTAWATGLGKRSGLHMSELRWQSKQNHRIKALLETLGDIPYQFGLLPVFGGVNVADYSDLLSGTLIKKMYKGYLVTLLPLIAASIIPLKGDERVKLVFEEQTHYAWGAQMWGMAFRIFEQFKTPDGLPRLAGIEFIPKKSSSLTQPADYLAYAILQQHRDATSLKAKWTRPILEGRYAIGKFMTRNEIRPVIAKLMSDEISLAGIREIEALLDRLLPRIRGESVKRKKP
jgi:Protein of unknown function (DUF3800)